MQAHQAVRRTGRWWWIGALVLASAAALYAGWGWLAATGISAVLIALAPCLAMCALGLCMGRGNAKGELSSTEIRRSDGNRS